MVVIQLIFRGEIYGLSAYGFALEGDSAPLLFALILAGVLLMGGITGILILKWQSYAYQFGIVYCICGFAAVFYGQFLGMPTSEGEGAGQQLLLLCFLVHLIRNRKAWEQTTANKSENLTADRLCSWGISGRRN